MSGQVSSGFRRDTVTRWEALQEDIEQQRTLADLEARNGLGRSRAMARFKAWMRSESLWFQRTNTTYRIRTTDDRPDEAES